MVLARFPSVRQVLLAGEDTALRDVQGHIGDVLQQFVRVHGYQGLYVVRADGRLRAVVEDQPVGAATRERVSALARSAAAGCHLIEAEDASRWWLAVVAPVGGKEADEDRALGFVVTVVSPTRHLWPVFLQEIEGWRTREAVLVRREGDRVRYLSPLRFRPENETVYVPYQPEIYSAAAALAGEEAFGAMLDYRGVPVLAATRQVRGIDWAISAEIDVAEAMSETRARLVLRIAAGTALWAAIVAWGVASSRRRQARRMEMELANERRVAEERSRFELLKDRTKDLMLLIGPDGRLVDANHAAEAAYGFSRHELLERTVFDLNPPSMHGSVRDRLRRALEAPVMVETEHVRRDGSRFPVEVSAVAAPLGGEVILFEIIRDISERRAAAARIEHLQSVLNAVRGINQMLVRATDRQQLLQSACDLLLSNRAYRLVWIGVPRLEAGMPVQPVAVAGAALSEVSEFQVTWDDSPSGHGPTGTAIRERRAQVVRSVLSDPAMARWHAAAQRLRLLSAASVPIIHEGALYGALSVYAGAEGHFDSEEVSLLEELAADLGYALHSLEVRLRHDAAIEDLRASEARFRAIFENVSVSIALFDCEGRFIEVNEATCRLLGYSRAELIGESFALIVPPTREEAERQLFRSLLARAGPGGVSERTYRRKDGSLVWVRTSSGLIRDTSGAPLYLAAVAQDITEQREAEERVGQREREILQLNTELERRVEQRTAALAAVNRELEAFNYSVSHDLRAPLRHIDGFVRLLEQRFADVLPQEGRRYLDVISSGSRRMGELIDALLALSRVGRATLQRRPVDVAQVVRTAFADLEGQNPGPVELIVGSLPMVEGDPILLRQLFVNLLSNALKFTRPVAAPRIEVGVERHQEGSVFFVRDNGVGFDPTFASKLFGVFQRLHTDPQFEGTGIGLSIVQRIVERHGGRIWGEGRLGQGATFYFTIPALEA